MAAIAAPAPTMYDRVAAALEGSGGSVREAALRLGITVDQVRYYKRRLTPEGVQKDRDRDRNRARRHGGRDRVVANMGPWTPDEESTVIRMKFRGSTNWEIAQALHRSEAAVIAKRADLRRRGVIG